MGPLGFLVDHQMFSGVLSGSQCVMMGSLASCGALTGLTRVLSGPPEFLGGLMDSQRGLWVLMWPQELQVDSEMLSSTSNEVLMGFHVT